MLSFFDPLDAKKFTFPSEKFSSVPSKGYGGRRVATPSPRNDISASKNPHFQRKMRTLLASTLLAILRGMTHKSTFSCAFSCAISSFWLLLHVKHFDNTTEQQQNFVWSRDQSKMARARGIPQFSLGT